MIFNYTDVGLALQAKILTGKRLIISRVVASTGYSNSPSALTDVINEIQDLQIEDISTDDGTTATITALLTNLQIDNEYTLTQIGVFATDPDDSSEILYIIGQDRTGERVPAISELEISFTYNISTKVTNASTVEYTANPSQFVTNRVMAAAVSEVSEKLQKNITDFSNNKIDKSNIIHSAEVTDATKVAGADLTNNLQQQITTVNNNLGDTGELTTNAKDNVVEAINKVNDKSAYDDIVTVQSTNGLVSTNRSQNGGVRLDKMHGKSIQKSYTGKNLLPYPYRDPDTKTNNGITYTVNSNGSITVVGTASDQSRFYFTNNLTYTFKTKVYFGRQPDSKVSSWANGKNVIDGSAVEANASYGTFFIFINAGTVVSETVYPMIVYDTETDTTYEPYVGGMASPNPDYPQEIESIGDNGISLIATGKNLFNPAKLKNLGGFKYDSDTDSFKILCDNSKKIFYSDFLPYTKYRISVMTYNPSHSYATMVIFYTDGTHIETDNISSTTEYTKVTITSDENKIIEGIGVRYWGNVTYYKNLQIEVGDTATDFELYKSSIVNISNIPLYGIPVANGGNYTDKDGQQWICDSIEYKDGTWKNVKRLQKITIDGTEALSNYIYASAESPTNGYAQIIPTTPFAPSNNTISCPLLSDRFINVHNSVEFFYKGTMCTSTEGKITLGLLDGWTDNASIKQWFTENPTIFIGELATPVEIELTEVEMKQLKLLRSYAGCTNAFTNQDIVPDFECTMTSETHYKNMADLIQLNDDLDALDNELTGHKHTKSEITDFPTSMPASDVSSWAKAAQKPSYSASEVGASPTGHKHTKSEITDFPTSMPASDVQSWAKATSKPSYNASEVGASPTGHKHTKSDITDFPSGLNSGYVRTGQKAQTTIGEKATAEGDVTTASGECSHAEGQMTIASGSCSHAEGIKTKATSYNSHAEGQATTASGIASHAGGVMSEASGSYGFAHGDNAKAIGMTSCAIGSDVRASGMYQTVIGSSNVEYASLNNYDSTSTLFIIGNGTIIGDSNAFRVTAAGQTYAKAAYSASGADYAEYFEWLDGNLESEDRRGYFVTMEGKKIKKATSNTDYILGIVSANPVIIGNADTDWQGRFFRDEFNQYVMEHYVIDVEENLPVEVKESVIDENGNESTVVKVKTEKRTVTKEFDFYKINPDYDETKEYVERANRPEWSAIGMVGVLGVRQDGTCVVNGYCCCDTNGMATRCDRTTEGAYRVIDIVNESVVNVIIK